MKCSSAQVLKCSSAQVLKCLRKAWFYFSAASAPKYPVWQYSAAIIHSPEIILQETPSVATAVLLFSFVVNWVNMSVLLVSRAHSLSYCDRFVCVMRFCLMYFLLVAKPCLCSLRFLKCRPVSPRARLCFRIRSWVLNPYECFKNLGWAIFYCP